jgi:hypothetical protein
MFHLLSILLFFASSIWYAVSACLFLFSSLLKLCSKRWKLVASCQKPDVIYTYAPSCIYKYTILAYIYLYNYLSQSVSQHILAAFKNFRVPTDAREGARLPLVSPIARVVRLAAKVMHVGMWVVVVVLVRGHLVDRLTGRFSSFSFLSISGGRCWRLQTTKPTTYRAKRNAATISNW